MARKPISLCVLVFGDHPDLAHRCLSSVWYQLEEGSPYIEDVRLGLNQISPNTRTIVDWFVENTSKHFGIPLLLYDCEQNAFKYPLMRRMILDDEYIAADRVAWLDDDSYLLRQESWWPKLSAVAADADVLGKIYYQAMQPSQWDWIQKQPWFNPNVGMPQSTARFRGRPSFKFCTGGWWVAKTKIFRDHDWPTKELKLIGGDSMLGELCRHVGYKIVNFEEGVMVNAGPTGGHSTAPCRGESPSGGARVRALLGVAEPPCSAIHEFKCKRSVR